MKKEVWNIWYRAITPDGKVWVESSSKQEVIRASQGIAVEFQQLVTRLVPGEWEEME